MLKNIKSKYILKLLFNLIGKYKTLRISHRNKFLNNELEITANDYKDVYENIEINIKLSDEPELYQEKNTYFIHINFDDLKQDTFEIYFDDKKMDKERQFVTKEDKISSILVRIKPQVKSFRNLFENCSCIKEINFINCVRRNIIDMSYMFYGCSSLTKLDLSRLKTDNVTDMSYMFYGCSLLNEINIRNFRTMAVTNMEGMFKNCDALKTLDVSFLETQSVINLSQMFYGDKSLTYLNTRNFNTNNVKYMDKLFYGCSSLSKLELFCLIISSEVDTSEMFKDCLCFKEGKFA